MSIIFLDRISSVPLANDTLSAEFGSWVTDMIDTENENIGDIETQLNGGGIATFITVQTSVGITALIDMDALPVLPVGSFWFDTTLSKLVVLVTAAVPGVSNGVTEVVTST